MTKFSVCTEAEGFLISKAISRNVFASMWFGWVTTSYIYMYMYILGVVQKSNYTDAEIHALSSVMNLFSNSKGISEIQI